MLYTSRRSEGGIAPVSGTGDRGFESRRFDQKDRFLTVFFHFVVVGADENPPGSIIKRNESASSLVSE